MAINPKHTKLIPALRTAVPSRRNDLTVPLVIYHQLPLLRMPSIINTCMIQADQTKVFLCVRG